jgi:hypothetical protein
MQQVNFYQDEFKKIDVPFSAVILVIVLGYCLVISIVISGVLFGLSQFTLKEYENSQKDLVTLVGELETTRKAYPAPIIDSRLISKIDILEERQSKNQRLLKYLVSKNVDVDHQSFSVMLSALSKVNQNDLWLTKVTFKKGGNEIELIGRTLKAASLPDYLTKLSTLNAFSDMEFEVFDMERTNSGLKFVVSSKREKNDIEALLEKVSKSN